jgi:hypothetical protein
MINNCVLPYDHTNPVIYDNDCHCDVYTDEILFALSSAGELDVRGFITTTPANPAVTQETYELDCVSREEMIRMARNSGMKNVPPHFRGPSRALEKPESEKIEDTSAIDTPGSRLIVQEAQKASAERPLVLVMGGPLTVAADAFLLDNSIADKVVISWLGGNFDDMNDGYNGWIDPWAAYIVIQKMRLVQFPGGYGMPDTPKSDFEQLPNSVLRQWMIDKRLPHVNPLPESLNKDWDGQPVISMLRKDYVLEMKKVVFSHFIVCPDGSRMPAFREVAEGNAIVVTQASESVATEEWWKAMSSTAAWGDGPRILPAEQRPFYAAPFPIGLIQRFEAEDFDHGGEGVAFHRADIEAANNIYRSSNVMIRPAQDIPGGYLLGAGGGFCVTGLKAGDWLEYTLDLQKEGFYDIGVRTASRGMGGSIHIEFDGEDRTGSIVLPDTKGDLDWTTVHAGKVYLEKGIKIMKLFVESVGDSCSAGNINYFEMIPV